MDTNSTKPIPSHVNAQGLYVAICDICGAEAAPAKDEKGMRRHLALHKRHKHGIVGKGNARYLTERRAKESKRLPVRAEAKANWRGNDAAAKKSRAQYKKDWWEKNKDRVSKEAKKKRKAAIPAAVTQPTAERTVVAAKLDACPNCGTRFYMATEQG